MTTKEDKKFDEDKHGEELTLGGNKYRNNTLIPTGKPVGKNFDSLGFSDSRSSKLH